MPPHAITAVLPKGVGQHVHAQYIHLFFMLLQSPYLVAGTAFEGSKPHAEVGRILVFEVARKPRDDAHPAGAMADETEAKISLRLLANQEVDEG